MQPPWDQSSMGLLALLKISIEFRIAVQNLASILDCLIALTNPPYFKLSRA